ncbi:hypothetical protein [Paracoccus aminovorans]|uniref:hypothetical protein n=1 Tax=Paracoccus aminovorans TaxID=34004 RepID=UPI002B25A701|nr:hypothetical protein [Paracoccus aminovorans]
MPPAPLQYNETTFALPAFRVMGFFDLPVADSRMRAAARRVLDLFLAAAGDRLAWFIKAGGGSRRPAPQPVDDRTIAQAREWLAQAPFEWPSTLRFNGWLDAPDSIVAPPHLRIEQRAHLALIQVELPPDTPDPAGFADAFCAAVAGLPLVWGVMGMGLYLPTAKDSLVWMLPRVTPRFRAAIEVQPDQAERALRRASGGGEDDTPRIPDTGWRCLLGPDLAAALDLSALAGTAGVEIRDHGGFTAITAGPAPIWGDVNRAEDISVYRAAAQALRPARVEWNYVRNALFGSGGGDEKIDRLEDWFTRYGA